jgi:hypothetical protein
MQLFRKASKGEGKAQRFPCPPCNNSYNMPGQFVPHFLERR